MVATALPSDSAKDHAKSPVLDGVARALVDENPLPIALLDAEFRVRWLSSALAAMLQIDANACLGEPWARCHPQSWRVLEPLVDGSPGRRVATPNEEFVLRRLDAVSPEPSAPAWLMQAGGVRLHRGRSIRGVLTELDCSADVEQELATARERLSLALKCAQVGFFVWHLPSDTAAGLEDWCTSVGLPAEVAVGFGSRWLELIHAEDRSNVVRARGDHFNGVNAMYECEYRLQVPGGSELWLLERAQVTVRGAAGEPRQVAGILMDVALRKTAETNLKRSESRLAAAVRAGGLGLFEYDMRARSTHWFSSWLEQNGFVEVGQSLDLREWDARIHPDDASANRDRFERFLNGELPDVELEYRVRRSDSSWRWVASAARVLETDAQGRPLRLIGLLSDIHARKEAELAVARREFVYRTVNQLNPGYVGEFEIEDGQVRATWVSEGFEEIYGRSLEEMHRIGWTNVYTPASRTAAMQRMQRLLAGERTIGDAEIVRPDGAHRWLRIATNPVRDPLTRQVSRCWSLVQDVTAQKLAEQGLRASEQRLRLVAEQAPDWLMLVDSSYRFILVNKPMFGLQPEQLVGRSVLELRPPEEMRELRTLLERAARGEAVEGFEHTSVPGYGPPRDLFTRARAIRIDGALLGYVITTADVTGLRRQQRTLRLQADILETMREGVVLLDDSNVIRFANPAFRRLAHTDRTDEIIEGQLFQSVLRPSRAQRVLSSERLFLDLGRVQGSPAEVEFRRRDGGSLTAECVVRPMQIDGHDHWLLAITDVSDRKILERQILAISNREQRRIGNDLHDGLGQELTGVALLMRAHLSRLSKTFPHALPEGEEVMSVVNRAIESTRALARGLSPVSAKGGGLAGALRDLAHRAHLQSGRNVTLRTRMASRLALDDGAADHLYRIAQEALSNALKHGHSSEVRILLTVTVRSVRLSVRDDGRGLALGHDDSRGLGLRTMQYRAESIGGRLSVRNHPLGGVVVRCICPQDALAARRR